MADRPEVNIGSSSDSDPDGDRHWRREHPLVFVRNLGTVGEDGPGIIDLDADDDAHLRRSLRLRPGAGLTVGDGDGRWRRARLVDGSCAVEAAGPIRVEQPPPYPLTVAFAPVKGQKPEWVVQKLTELGVDRIIALRADRAVVRWDPARADKQMQRWERIIREAAMQSRQLFLPTFGPPVSVTELIALSPAAVSPAALSPTAVPSAALPPAALPSAVHLAEPGGEAIDARHRVVAIGPEGGWSDSERQTAPWVRLPGGILRAETAVVAAATLMAAARERAAGDVR